MNFSLDIISAGLLTTLQDSGRTGARSSGVPVGGAADRWSHAVANLILLNAPGTTVLEISGGLFSARARGEGQLAACGLGGTLFVNGERTGNGRAVFIRDGDLVEIRPDSGGCYTCLAVSGGWLSEQVLGSESTCLAGGFGGFSGRRLMPGDALFSAASYQCKPCFGRSKWFVPDLYYSSEQPLRVMPGPEFSDSCEALFDQIFVVTQRRNRMGVRLCGEKKVLPAGTAGDMISSIVSPGVVQAPPDGQPFVLLADAQTTGGYPRIGQIIAADIPLLAQMPSGTNIRFIATDWQEAEISLWEMERMLAKIGAATRLHSLFLPPHDI
jgi:antagonist of KipI